MKKYKFIIIFLLFLILIKNDSLAAENKQNYLITFDFNDNYLISDKELDILVKEACEKSFQDVLNIKIDSVLKEINIELLVDENNGNINSLINTSLYNYFSATKFFDLYDINFYFNVKYTDVNGRSVKKHMYSYTFFKETLEHLNWNEISYKDFINNADISWNVNDGNSENKKDYDESLQLKILNILKDYFSYKLNNK